MHDKIVLKFCFLYIFFVNYTGTLQEDSTTITEIDATVSSNDNINNYPNTFYNRTVEIDGKDMVFRVINGRPAQLGDVPYQVGMMQRNKGTNTYTAFCGGSIIGPTRVLTAAHCFVKDKFCDCYQGTLTESDFQNKLVMAGYVLSTGCVPLNETVRTGQWRFILRGKYPETYKFPLDDIAVIYTDRAFLYNSYVSPIQYASLTKEYSGNCLISGYGRTADFQPSDRLLLAEVEVLSNQDCSAIHKENMSKFVCTSDAVSDLHKGDSGGPIVCQNTRDPKDQGKGVQIGITCGKRVGAASGTFFTRISYFYKFVNTCSSLQSSYTFVILNFSINSFSLF